MESLIRHLRDTQALAKLIGEAPAFLQAIGQLPAVAKSEAMVLITGETGTGKELVARAIHYLSKRAPFPFVPLKCGSLPDTLLEAELFGHERGAFTDAHSRRLGLIAQAVKGTLFLDFVPSGPAANEEPMCGSWLPPMPRSTSACEAGPFGRISTIGSASAPSTCLPYVSTNEDIRLLASHFVKKHAPADRAMLQRSSATTGPTRGLSSSATPNISTTSRSRI